MVVLLPVSAALAVSRYHLYDVDRILSRAVTYVIVSTLLIGAYVAVVVVLARAFGQAVNRSPTATTLGTLVAAAAARPVYMAVRDAVDRYRSDRSPKSLATDAAYALAATIAFALALVLLLAFMRSFNRFAAARHQKYIAPLEAKSSRILRADQIWRLLHAVLRGFWILVGVILFYAYLNFLLGLFPCTRAFSNRLSDLVGDPVLTAGVAILEAIPDLILVLILIVITRYLLRLTRLFFNAIRDGHLTVGRFLPEWADPTYRIARLVIVAFAFVIAYPYLPGSGTAAFHGVSIFLGVLLSLGSSSFISNVIAGHTLTYRRAFRVGDVVKIQDTVGEVVETGLLVTRLRTKQNERARAELPDPRQPAPELQRAGPGAWSRPAHDCGHRL
jgi:small-conductance mechanosensitive channel